MKNISIFVLFTILNLNFSYSQITVSTVEKKEVPIKVYEPYDGSTNINQKKLLSNKDYYYGLEGFFIPFEAMSFHGFEVISEQPNTGLWLNSEDKYNGYNFIVDKKTVESVIANKKFRILEGITGPELQNKLLIKSDSIRKSNSKAQLASSNFIKKEFYNYDPVYVKILNEENNSVYYFRPGGLSFILSDYYEGLKKKYLNQTVVVTNNERWLNDSRNKVKELTTDELINLPYRSKWNVIEITIFKGGYKLSLILENENIGRILYTLDPDIIDNFNRNVSMGMNNGYNLALLEDFQIQILKDKKAQEEKARAIAKRKKELEIAETNRQNQLIEKYGNDFGKTISNGKVKIGMTSAMCVEAWGMPISKKTIVTEDAKLSQWTFYGNRKLIFKDNVLLMIEY